MRKAYLPRPAGLPGANNPRRIYSTTPIEIDLARSSDQFRCIQISEPNLIFGDRGSCTDPRTGLALFGPYGTPEIGDVTPIRVGIVGTLEGIEVALSLLQELRGPIDQDANIDCVLHPSFPGINSRHPFRSSFVSRPEWLKPLDREALCVASELEKLSARIRRLEEMFCEQVRTLSELNNPPQVVLCAVNESISSLLADDPVSDSTEHVSPVASSWDGNTGCSQQVMQTFQAGLKAACMGSLPTELLWDARNSKPYLNRDRATQAWNLSLALLHKAGVTPWRLENAAEASCFVGISNYSSSNCTSPKMTGSFAHIFTELGQGFVVPGDPFEESSEPGNSVAAKRSEEHARRLLMRAVGVFEDCVGFPPRKVIVHKTTPYSQAERSGFGQVLSQVPTHALITVSRSGISFIRPGCKPLLRGTSIPFDEKTGLIATSGYVPFLRAPAGNELTQPLAISENWGSISFRQAAEDILRLTKLNLSSPDFCSELPITLSQNTEIGDVLSASGQQCAPTIDTYYV